jgi:SAM-dependent methyltransferase
MRPVIDRGRTIDWGATSGDYAAFRPGPPDEFYDRLRALGIGLPRQRILDLGTGTGVVARALARHGSVLAGIDIAPAQIAEARRLAAAEQLQIDFRVAPAEDPPFANHSFDVATANQCFLYFDQERTLAAVRRLLVPGGRLVTSHFNWLPSIDPIAGASEQLILKFNSAWLAAGFDGKIEPVPDWIPKDILLEGFFWFDVDMPSDRKAWRGRIRASRGIGASLPASEVEAFDKEHAALLERIAPETFSIRHRIDAHIFRFP